jgi:alpha-L-rhamnosidase
MTPPDSWTASWIEPTGTDADGAVRRPAHLLARELVVDGPVDTAVLHATAHGIYEAFLNGTRVGNAELTPGYTSYRHTLQVQSYDVTDLLVVGPNVLGAVLSDGWWRGQIGFMKTTDVFGPSTALLAQLHVKMRDGTERVVGTDADWRSTRSHILAADLIAGEVHDQRRRTSRWAEASGDRSSWSPVRVADHGFDVLAATIGPPVRQIEELAPVSVTALGPGRHVVDFGQNSNGWIRLDDLGPAGTTLTITYGECLDGAGDVTQQNVDFRLTPPDDDDVPFQTDTVISAGDGTTFEPRHSTKGFRYVRVDGHPGRLDPSSIASVVVHTDLPTVGSFTCSDEQINRLHRVASWSFRTNACDIPTDCPTRERAGWTGDCQLFVDAAAFLYDVGDFSRKWLRDLAADQRPDGLIHNVAPEPTPDDPIMKGLQGSAGWGDAIVHVPWELYRATGRTDVLHEQFDAMARWVDWATTQAATGRHPARRDERPDARPHETYLWDTGWHFGEWLEPGDRMEDTMSRLGAADHGPVATAYLHRSATELAAIATIVGDPDRATTYARVSAGALDAWQREYLDADGHVAPATQANLVRALAFDLLPDDLRPVAVADLVALIRAAGTHLATGFLSTPFLLPMLADHGHLDVAYELLQQTSAPSWLHMIERGATTMWESWDAVDDTGLATASLNHYSKGAVIGFLHRYVGGLDIIEPGYRRFRVAPRPGGGITSAHVHHVCPHGCIEVTWSLDGDTGTIDVAVPDQTTAELVIPDGRRETLTPGSHTYHWVDSTASRL